MMIQTPRSNVRSQLCHTFIEWLFPQRRQRHYPVLPPFSLSLRHCPKLFFLCGIFYKHIIGNVKCVYMGVSMEENCFWHGVRTCNWNDTILAKVLKLLPEDLYVSETKYFCNIPGSWILMQKLKSFSTSWISAQSCQFIISLAEVLG